VALKILHPVRLPVGPASPGGSLRAGESGLTWGMTLEDESCRAAVAATVTANRHAVKG